MTGHPVDSQRNENPISTINEPGKNQSKMLETTTMLQYTWSNFFQQTIAFAKSLIALGIPARSCITIQGINTPEHFIAVMGVISANCIFSDQYVTNSPAACLTQIKHSESKFIIADSWQTLKEKYLPYEDELLKLGVKYAVVYSEFGTTFRGDGRATQQ